MILNIHKIILLFILIAILAMLTDWFPNFGEIFCIRKIIRKRKSYTCPKFGPNWAVITTINYPTDTIRTLAKLQEWVVIIVADEKTPKNWFSNDTDLLDSNIILLTLEEQLQLDFELIHVIPISSYARKNIGYLCAIKCGAKLIYETDDNNKFIEGYPLKSISPEDSLFSILEAVPPNTSTKPLVNPYALYGHPEIWPRGFPLQSISESNTYEFYNIRRPFTPIQPVIQQSLADLDPDVDAIYRLTQPNSIGKIQFKTYPEALAIGSGYFSPFNTQNTLYMQPAFWGLFIPISTTFRVCDIWRGYWVQRLLWDVEGSLVFRPASVKQIRNAHNYFKDFQEELDLYLKSGKLIDFLSTWKTSKTDLFERMQELIEQMVIENFWGTIEIKAIHAWINDLKRLRYIPPSVKQRKIATYDGHKGKTAICMTGQLDRISKGWPFNKKSLDPFFESASKEYDMFYYVSTYNSKNEDDENFLKSYIQPAFGILYNDPPLSPKIATNYLGLRPGWTPKNLFQQLYGLKRCYEIVEKYSQENNITYEYMMRLRTDTYVLSINNSISKMIWNAVENDRRVIFPYDGLEYVIIDESESKSEGFKNLKEIERIWINDKMAFGPLDKMKYYMKRYDDMSMKEVKSLMAETYTRFIMSHYNVSIMRVEWKMQEVRN